MELAILITVNLIISFLIYVAFSIRFRMALDKERKNRVPRAFYDNLQMTIQYINTATSAVDEKTQHFYRQLRRSEDVLKRLEKANEEFDRNLKKSKRKRKTGPNPELVIPDSVDPKADSSPGQPADFEPRSRRKIDNQSDNLRAYASEESNTYGSQDFEEDSQELASEGRHMERLLAGMQEDVIQVSSAEEEDFGNSRGPSRESRMPVLREKEEPGSSGLLARIGGMVGRVLGINSEAFTFGGNSEAEESGPENQRKKGAFDREVDRMSRAPAFQRDSKATGRNAEPSQQDEGFAGEDYMSTATHRNQRKDYYVSGLDPEGSYRKTIQGSATSPGKSDEDNDGKEGFPQNRSDPKKGQNLNESGRSRELSFSEQQSIADELPEYASNEPLETTQPGTDQDRRIARVQEFLESTGINLLDTSPQTRAVLIRELGTLGFDPPDIIRATRFPPSEVALVLQLPSEPGDNRRRTRKIRS